MNSSIDLPGDALEENRDGYGAKPVDPDSFLMAVRLFHSLPRMLPLPDVSVDPDGEVAFEWYVEPRRSFSVSVGADGVLTYAGLFGSAKVHGTEHLVDELPETIRWNLHRLLT